MANHLDFPGQLWADVAMTMERGVTTLNALHQRLGDEPILHFSHSHLLRALADDAEFITDAVNMSGDVAQLVRFDDALDSEDDATNRAHRTSAIVSACHAIDDLANHSSIPCKYVSDRRYTA